MTDTADLGLELKTYLKTVAAVTTLVGTGTSARIYFHQARQKAAVPYIVFDIYGDHSFEHLSGIAGLIRSRVQINCYGTSSSQSHSLSEKVRLSLQGKRNLSVGSILMHGIESIEGFERGFDSPETGDDTPRWYVERDYIMTYSETIS